MRFWIWAAVLLGMAIVFGSGLIVGFRVGQNVPRVVTVENVLNADDTSGNRADMGTFWQAWDEIDKKYLRSGEVSSLERIHGAVRGLVGSLEDNHSVFFTPEEGKKFQEDVQGNFGGIGAEIGIRNDQLVVVAPLKNTPAERAGLKPGDNILLINQTSTDGLSVEQAVRLIRGKEGTEVKLTIFRDSWEKPKEIPIVRGLITIPTLDYEMKEGQIAYVALHSFNSNSNPLFFEAMFKLLNQGARGLILDLRNNPGGYLSVAVDMAGWFIPRGSVVVTENDKTGPIETLRAAGNAALVKFPVVVLINGGSASASEILAGALRDNRQVPLVGEQSFGKGTVQEIIELRDGSSMKLTIAKWVLPNGQVLEREDGGGLAPDYEVKPSDKDTESNNDVQLTKAIEVMRGLISKGER